MFYVKKGTCKHLLTLLSNVYVLKIKEPTVHQFLLQIKLYRMICKLHSKNQIISTGNKNIYKESKHRQMSPFLYI